MNLYIVGKVLEYRDGNWEFMGVFDTYEAADKICVNEDYFIGLAKLNEALPNETIDWPTYWWPRREE